MPEKTELPRIELSVDPFHSDDSDDVMMRRLRDLRSPAQQMAAGLSRGTTDQTGRFSYLFPDLAADPFSVLPTDADGDMLPSILTGLETLASNMNNASNDSTIPAGITYLGQFIDHDITFDPTSSLARLNDPGSVMNFRTPGLNLDNLYGGGPRISPYLYDGNKLRPGGHALGRDLPRTVKTSPAEGDQDGKAKALIGDPRNDENLLIAQLHSAFIGFHNSIVDIVAGDVTIPAESKFDEASKLVRWHYQWIVVNQFLPSILKAAVLNDVITNGNKFYLPGVNSVSIPVEFSMAAYRFGHSMIRDNYFYNNNFQNASLLDLFFFTGHKITPGWEKAEWRTYLQFGATAPSNLAKQIDTKIANLMFNIPAGATPISVPRNNLRRGYAFTLPTGQAVARRLGFVPLTEAEVSQTGGVENLPFTMHPIFKTRTPLWYYILKEAEVRENGSSLGDTGSRIVAEVFMGLLKSDRSSYLNSPQGSAWRPALPPRADGTAANDFKLQDVFVYAGHALANGNPT